jgi:thioredoxin-dependent peroxiredoxin
MRHFILHCLVAATLIGALGRIEGAETPITHTPKAGDKAPPVEGKNQDGQLWTLQDALKSGPVLLYFYPKDDTPGCTKEACGLRDRMGDLKKDQVQVVGVSFDPATKHQEFIQKYHLNFPLLVDTDGKIADAYGVRMAGKSMARRVSFLIDRNGTIRHVTDNPAADTHLAEMKEAVASLAKNGS